ncbi:MAG: Fic family protein [Spirochaetales bacterium]|nr:Fic family protein [Spirochaetales bacterium]
MHKFNLYEEHKQYFTPKIMSLVTKIYQYKGRQDLFVEMMGNELECFEKSAKIQSTLVSNRMSSITTTDSRLNDLANGEIEPKNLDEEEIAGYYRVLSSILQNHDYIPCKPYYILQLHRDLYSLCRTKNGGQYKSFDRTPKGPFRPVRANDTERAMDDLFDSYDSAFETEGTDPLILIPIMLMDFLCIHPFTDATYRMSRLLSILACCKHGFILGKYISIEQIMEKHWEEFNEAFLDSSEGWHENESNYEPFICWFLSVLLESYEAFEKRVDHLRRSGKSKPQLIEEYILSNGGKITKKEILEYFPDIGEITVERTLHSLCQKGMLKKQGVSRATFYVRCE